MDKNEFRKMIAIQGGAKLKASGALVQVKIKENVFVHNDDCIRYPISVPVPIFELLGIEIEGMNPKNISLWAEYTAKTKKISLMAIESNKKHNFAFLIRLSDEEQANLYERVKKESENIFGVDPQECWAENALVKIANKMDEEYAGFIDGLLKMDTRDAMAYSYEKVIKDNILMLFDEPDMMRTRLSNDQILALLSCECPLNSLYDLWLNSSESWVENLRNSIRNQL